MIRSLILGGLTAATPARAFAGLTRDRLCVFMLHRFRDACPGVRGHDREAVSGLLERLRREGYTLVDLEEGLRRLREGEPLSRAVAFTLDDGYRDQVEVGSEVFGAYDCPSTVFVTTGFQDGTCWMWWDQVEHVLSSARQTVVELPLGTGALRVEVGPGAAAGTAARLIEALKRCSDVEMRAALETLSDACEVPIPGSPPAACAPAGWDAIRGAGSDLMRFAPHTVTHPVLSRVDDQQARHEILGSWARLSMEVARPVPVLAYPNGLESDYGAREVALVREAGLDGAVTVVAGHPSAAGLAADPDARYRVPRFDLPDDHALALQYASGLERLKDILLHR